MGRQCDQVHCPAVEQRVESTGTGRALEHDCFSLKPSCSNRLFERVIPALLSQCGDEPPRATLRVHVLRERRVLVDDTQDLLATEIRHLQKRALNAGLPILAENCRVCWSTKYGNR